MAPVEDRRLEDAPNGRRAGFLLLLLVAEGVGEPLEAAVARRPRLAFFRLEEALAPVRARMLREG